MFYVCLFAMIIYVVRQTVVVRDTHRYIAKLVISFSTETCQKSLIRKRFFIFHENEQPQNVNYILEFLIVVMKFGLRLKLCSSDIRDYIFLYVKQQNIEIVEFWFWFLFFFLVLLRWHPNLNCHGHWKWYHSGEENHIYFARVFHQARCSHSQ